jgi:steroid 5-alpha reductase family enzyme
MEIVSIIGIFRSVLEGYTIIFQNLLLSWVALMVAAVTITFILSEITRNYSQVDKIWSLLPLTYGWVTVTAQPSPRLYIMAVLVTIWGIRLSYNFSRKGGYSIFPWKGEEDYRWKVLRNNPFLRGRIRFGLFNLLFISLYQNIVIFLFSSPFLLAALYPERDLTVIDTCAALLMLTFIITESIADNQQFRFQQQKKSIINGKKLYAESLGKGFLTEGLWKYVRHPNFTSEQAIWISFYLFGVAASGRIINITLAGSILLILIFMGSSRLTERISSSKYNGYVIYQKEVPRFLPKKTKLLKGK